MARTRTATGRIAQRPIPADRADALTRVRGRRHHDDSTQRQIQGVVLREGDGATGGRIAALAKRRRERSRLKA